MGSSAVSVIFYNGGNCMVCKALSNDVYSNYPIPTEAAGKYAVLKYIIDGNDPKFVYMGYTDL